MVINVWTCCLEQSQSNNETARRNRFDIVAAYILFIFSTDAAVTEQNMCHDFATYFLKLKLFVIVMYGPISTLVSTSCIIFPHPNIHINEAVCKNWCN